MGVIHRESTRESEAGRGKGKEKKKGAKEEGEEAGKAKQMTTK
jgi:hypothetical protein